MERKKFKIIIFLTLAFNSVFAQNYLDSLLIVAAKNNPGLKAKYYKYMADLQKVPQVGALPDPDVSFGFFIQPMELMSGNQIGQIQLMQMFPWIGTLKAAKDEASAMALSSLELFRAEKDELFFNIRKNYYRLSLVNKQIQTYDSTLILLKSLEQLLLSKNKTSNTGIPEPVNSGTQLSLFNSSKQNNSMGMNQNNLQSGQQKMSNLSMSESNSAFSDLLKLQIEIKEVTDNISTLKTSYQQLTIQINILLNCKPGTVIVVSDSLNTPLIDFNNPTIFDSIKANNPMIRMNKTDIQVFQLRQVMNKKMG
ncbi:MAG: TolC family protein [Bacteroidota bacterium]|nr:TolC family protein [Bacteroidota bacterium]